MKSVRFVDAAGRASAVLDPAGELAPEPPDGALTAGWEPQFWLGAPPASGFGGSDGFGGLALPAAQPTAAWLYAPRGVHLGHYRGRDILVAADTGNHRVLIWHDLPTADHQPCDVVLGQPNATSEGAAAGGRSTRYGLFLPTGVIVHDGMLIVADAWHHRVLIYYEVPQRSVAEPDLVLGQDGLERVDSNRGGPCRADSMCWPFGVAVIGGRFYVADTGNRRVLGWSGGIPTSADTRPDLILGQSAAADRAENRGGSPAADSLRWPHDLAGTDQLLLVSDAGNHRVLGWVPPPAKDRAADLIIGQPDFTSAAENPYAPQRSDALRFPYGIDVDEARLAVADTANNRILFWQTLPGTDAAGIAAGADGVLGQPHFGVGGENRWNAVTHDSLCWPYGLSLRGDRLAIADSGNNRIVLWRRN